jgi:hypothetical protein
MSDGYFNALIKEISAPEMTQAKIVDVIKTASNNQYFLYKHILKIFEFFPVVKKTELFQPRVEIIVIVFGRTIDWLGLTNIYNVLFPFERHMLVKAPPMTQHCTRTLHLNFPSLYVAVQTHPISAHTFLNTRLICSGSVSRILRVIDLEKRTCLQRPWQ